MQSVYPFSDQSGEKTLPDGATHTYIAYIREYTPRLGKRGESPFIIHFAQVPKERCYVNGAKIVVLFKANPHRDNSQQSCSFRMS